MQRFKTIALLALAAAFTAPASAMFYNSPFACGPDSAPELITVTYLFPGSGMTHDFQVEIHTPQNVPAGLPAAAVIWSHGGGPGNVSAMRALAEATTLACYVSVSIGHKDPSAAVRMSFCLNQGITQADCQQVVDGLYKAADITEIVNSLEAQYGEIPIAVGGHSGGATATMTVADARRALGSDIVGPGQALDFSDPRPDAFIALSSTGPLYGGFFGKGFQSPVTSWDLVTRPVLTATGDGDNTCGSTPFNCVGAAPPWNRWAPHVYMPGRTDGAEPKFQLYINDVDAFHTVFRLSESKCVSQGGSVPQAKCDDIVEHLTAVVIAFVDASLRGVGRANGYLRSGEITNASAALDVEWRQK